MTPISRFSLLLQPGAGALLLGLLLRPALAYAHGHANDTLVAADYPPSYSAHLDHVGLIYAHIALMLLAWVFVLPVAVVLSLARSRHTFASQFIFLLINGLGLLLVTVYNAQTPDLYPSNAHHLIGWLVTWLVSAQALVGLVGWLAGAVRDRRPRNSRETLPFIAVHGGCRMSNDSGQGTEPNSKSSRSNSMSTLGDGDDVDGLDTHSPHNKDYVQEGDTIPLSSRPTSALAANIVRRRAYKYFDVSCRAVDRIILPLGFIALTTGIATFGRLFEGKAIFSGLAHWIKGGVFFWLGLFTLGRWSGSFGELGWAWNVRPPMKQQHKWRPSAEFVESALIFLYGSTNIFLEHLGSWGGEWSAQDLEHMAITVLFIGGGSCGMLIESARIRDLLNTTVSDAVPVPDEERQQQNPPATYRFSLNPIPAVVILLLGIVMSSHHQSTVVSSMIHKQWGNLLLGASFARVLTYLLMFLRPPTSTLPSRPPTELLASFGLIAGGTIFMASSSDTIAAIIHRGLDAMFIYTVTMGLVAMLMAWEIVVLAIKGWAIRRERQARCQISC